MGREGTAEVRAGLADRVAVWRAGRTSGATGFVSQPEPRSMGLYARGKQLVAGNILLAGHLAEAPGQLLWDIDTPDPAFAAEAHGFAWLDDLVAVGTAEARKIAQGWTLGWIDRFGARAGPGWSPDLTGRRVIRLLHHAIFLLHGQDKQAADALLGSLARQTAFLARRAPAARPGLPRFEALTGLLCASLALIGMERHVVPATAALTHDCAAEIGADGGIPSRNPEELLEVLTLLTWAVRALAEADREIPPQLSEAIDRIAPCLRTLRHADGGLARFHGGGKGVEGRLDQALAASAMLKPAGHLAQAMGFVRLSGGRTSVILDAAAPPAGAASVTAHASTGAIELTSGRRPMIVSCGSGLSFGPDWRLAGRATQSHSALAVAGYSSSRFGHSRQPGGLGDSARVTALSTWAQDGAEVYVAHDGWSSTHGLTCGRSLALSANGRRLSGVDTLAATTPEGIARFEQMLTRSKLEGVAFTIRFHLHPDVDATLDMGGTAVSMQLRSGEIWVFRHDGKAALALEPSVYLETGRLRPRPAWQVVLSAKARQHESRIGWTLAKAQDTPTGIRDLGREDPAPI
ncbi:heparinase II/III family protein [Rhodobacter sp. Har01]|uniref:heparinase II/III family protein n=1 Tax=Rhodobacter sp. Har01 TaxID=2883999 RepID=UPI001D064D73|nr:heparinase II/III family protein [Rhodobacter sp. Har01]MCB6179480.1 heparinase II/III family protein [Rhodobacter sp. Har01]